MDCGTPGLPVHHQLPEFTQTHVHWVGDAIQPSHPLLSPSPPALNISQHQGLFKWVLCIRWPKYWSFSFNISPSNEHSRLISFRMDWLIWGFPDSSVGKGFSCNAGNVSLIPGWGRSAGEGIGYLLQYFWASLVAHLVKNPPAMWETWVQTLALEDPLEKGKG